MYSLIFYCTVMAKGCSIHSASANARVQRAFLHEAFIRFVELGRKFDLANLGPIVRRGRRPSRTVSPVFGSRADSGAAAAVGFVTPLRSSRAESAPA